MKYLFYRMNLTCVVALAAVCLGSLGAFAQSTSTGAGLVIGPIETARSHLFGGNTDKTIPELLALKTGDLSISEMHVPGNRIIDPNKAPYPPPQLVEIACSSQIGILGTAESSVSHITSDERFVYSDWTVLVNQILENRIGVPASEGQTIVVVRPGGKIVMNNRTVLATDSNFGDFRAGEQYVLFLDYVPVAQAYTPDQEKTFHAGHKGVETLMLRPLYEAAEREGLDAFLVDARAAAGSCNDSQK